MKLALWLALLGTVLSAFGGNGAGNGGFAYVRRDHATHTILEVRFHDLWWGEKEMDLKIRRQGVPAEEQAKAMVGRLLAIDEEAFADLASELNRVVRQKKVLDEGVTLLEPDDLYKHIEPEPGSDAEVVALVNYTDDNAILVRRDLWQFLSDPHRAGSDIETDIAAMYLHEAIWKLIRNREHTKPPTSKEAAALVAYSFSDLTDAEFRDWYKNYRATGQLKLPDPIKEVRLEEGIYGETFGDKTKDENIARSRKSWEERCKAWQEKVTRELTPVSEYVYALCRESKVSRPVDNVAYSVYSNGIIIAKPKAAYLSLTEWLHGKAIAEHVASGYPQWYSELSHEQRCAEWKEEVKKRVGNRLFYASCGTEFVDILDRFDYFEQRPIDSTRFLSPTENIPHYTYVARQTASVGEIILLDAADAKWTTEAVEGPLYQYDESNAEATVPAAEDGWQQACKQFKAKYDTPDVLYATCDWKERERDIPSAIRKAIGQVQFTSLGSIYRLPKKH